MPLVVYIVSVVLLVVVGGVDVDAPNLPLERFAECMEDGDALAVYQAPAHRFSIAEARDADETTELIETKVKGGCRSLQFRQATRAIRRPCH